MIGPRKVKRRKTEIRHVETPSCDWARKHGWWHAKMKSPGKRSAPDRQFAKQKNDRSLKLAVEFKKPGKVATEKQELYHAEMRAAGWDVRVIDSYEEFVRQFEQLDAWLDGWLED